MGLRRRSWLFVLLVLGLLAGSVVAIALKPTVLGLDLQGGSQVILEARSTDGQPVQAADLQRAISVIRNRVDRFGVSEPEIQKQGTKQISVALPGIEDSDAVLDLVKPAQLKFYSLQRNLVGYQLRVGPSADNPIDGRPALYELINLANRQTATPGAGTQARFYLFRKNDAHTYVVGPAADKKDIERRLETTPSLSEAFREYTADPTKFELKRLNKGFVIVTNGQGLGTDIPDEQRCGRSGNCILLNDVVGLTGDDLDSANLGFDQGNNPTVQLQFTGGGRKKFADVTRDLVDGARVEGRPGGPDQADRFWNFAISLDDVIISSPYVSYDSNPAGIDSDTAEISGGFTESGARTLAEQLSSGAIPVALDTVSASQVSATLGEQSLRQGLIAGLIGLVLVMLALIAYYRVLGVIACLSLVVYGLYFWAIAKLVPIALTLPGIAGLILTIGVAADASVVIFERVREEARAGRSPRVAILNGYKRGITAIIDANVVTLVTAVFIFLLATAGPRGFAFTLILGVLVSLFTAIIATQGAFGLLVGTRLFQNERLMGFNAREVKWKMDVVGRWKLWLGISFIPMMIGILIIGIRGLEPGLDFKSGTQVQVVFQDQARADENGLRSELNRLGFPNSKIQKYTSDNPDGGKVTGFEIETESQTPQQTSQLIDAFEAKFGPVTQQNFETVGPTFGRDIIRNAIWAIVFSFLAIIAYLTLRFEYKLALPALASVVHDVWLALSVYSLVGKEVTGATVAALLTILGYSLYDVVILFDRIRENIPLMKGRPYRDIVNRSVHETLTRSIITMILTLLPITALLLFGGETLFDFSFALFVGILSGGISSIFISAPLAALWKEREPDARKAAARLAKKQARAAAVDADIMDVGAFSRAEQALGTPSVDNAPEYVGDLVEEVAQDNGYAKVEAEAIEPAVEDDPIEAAPESGDTELETPDAGGAPAATPPASPQQRPRRHRNVQRKRRR